MTGIRIATVAAALAFSACSVVGYPAGGPSGTAAQPRPTPTAQEPDRSAAPGAGGTSAAAEPRAVPNAVPVAEPLSRYGNPDEYEVEGTTYRVLETARGYVEEGRASWYGEEFHGRRTSSGEAYDMHSMSAAHRTLPLPTYVRVTNLDNGLSVVVRINDRGPFRDGRIIDVSWAAASRLGMIGPGTARVRVHALEPVAR